MANTILNSSLLTKEAVRQFHNNLGLGAGIDTQYKSEFAQSGAKIGSTVNVRKPVRFTVSTGQALDLQNVLEEQVPLTVAYQDHVDFQFSSADLALDIDMFSERYISPAMAALANKFDSRVGELYSKVWNYYGTPGTAPTAISSYTALRTALNLAGAPDEGKRRLVLTSGAHATAVSLMSTLFHAGTSIENQFKKGLVGNNVLGFNWYEDNNIATHTTGTLGGAPTVNGAGQTGASILTQSWTAAVANRLKKGDIIQFAGVYSVNPLTFASTGVLANFVVTADVASTAGGAATIPISPSIVISGSTQNVTGAPADAAAVTTFGHASTYTAKVTPQCLAFHPKAFTAAFVDLPLPRGADMASRISDPDLGISMRLWRQGDINTDQFPCRIDILYALDCLRPEFAARLAV